MFSVSALGPANQPASGGTIPRKRARTAQQAALTARIGAAALVRAEMSQSSG